MLSLSKEKNLSISNEELLKFAIEARENSYSPYSKFKVGCALLTKSGKIFLGCNIENVAFTPGICSERCAFSKAISEGEKEFVKIAIVGGANELKEICTPCGVCRQVMAEFCTKEFIVILGVPGKIVEFTLEQLLPYSFTKENSNL